MPKKNTCPSLSPKPSLPFKTSFQALVEEISQGQPLKLAGKGDTLQAALEIASQFQTL